MNRTVFVVLAAVAAWAGGPAAPLQAQAQAPASDPASVFAALDGDWRGEGTLMGRDAEFGLAWRVEGGLATLTFQNAFVGADGGVTPVLGAAAVYRTTPDRPEGVWLDSRGVRFELAWRAAGDTALVVTWTGTEESGRTTYRVVGPDALEVVDEVAVDGAWREFARSRLVRETPPPPLR